MEYPDNYGIGAMIEKASIEHRLARHKQQCIEEHDYLDRVALEAMKAMLRCPTYVGDIEELTADSYAYARAMLKASGRGGAV